QQTHLVRAPGGVNQRTTTTTYDGLGRVRLVTYPDGSTVRYSYDGFGRRVTMVDGLGTWTYAYNRMGHVTSVTDPSNNQVEYVYDAVGNRIALNVSGTPLTGVIYSYDAANRLDTLTDPFAGGGAVIDYSY